MNQEEFSQTYFPEVDCGREPCGNKVTVQLMHVKKMKGSIILAGDTQEFNKNSTVVAKVVKVGQIAYRHRETGETWKEGAWAKVGDIVLMPRYGGTNRVEIPVPNTEHETVIFCTYNDYDIVDKLIGQFEHYTKLL